ncbi:M10 family metallopeptidase C-terminal domain-containing protein [Seonamhaeicola marinus]|uniref:Uncharacterized protein n=1 Tax=Seonamhaeicola marinus TaxID=1912246 RepID=A0A5D0HXQ9_9FLAO|nr:M10 family metallopeptidase C-terminal domain-containing protein [Seonamhaeicola marinus]TYA74937.1 hypothetical protein FUA24_16695 [Seonamhaeicola marinus]
MAINTSGQPKYIKDLTDWDASSPAGINEPFSWTGNAGDSYTINYTVDHTKQFPLLLNPSITSSIGLTNTEIQPILDRISAVADIKFEHSTSNYKMVFADANLSSGIAAGIISPEVSGSTINKVNVYTSHNGNDFDPDEHEYYTLIHEVLHSLGLSHPDSFPNNPSYNTFTTLMSGRDQLAINANGIINDTYVQSSTPMVYDIAALQFLYGINTDHNDGDTVYTINAGVENISASSISISDSKDGNSVLSGDILTIWDGGGSDTYKIASNVTVDSRIDLRFGERPSPTSSEEEYINDPYREIGTYNSAVGDRIIVNALPNGVGTIENAIGAGGADEIYGNDADNKLEGLVGEDTIDGGQGDDHMEGGADEDTYHLNGDFGNDIIIDDGGVLLIDGEVLVESVDKGYASIIKDGVERKFTWERVNHFGEGEEANDLILKDDQVDAGTLTRDQVIIKDYFTNKANWNFHIDGQADATIKVTNEYLSSFWSLEPNHPFGAFYGVFFNVEMHNGETVLSADSNLFIKGADGLDTVTLTYATGTNKIYGGGDGDFFESGASSIDTFVYYSVEDSQADLSLVNTDIISGFTAGQDKIDVTSLGFSGIATAGVGGEKDLEYAYNSQSDQTTLGHAASGFEILFAGNIAFTSFDFIGLGNTSLTLTGDNKVNEFSDGAFDDNITTYGGNDITKLSSGNDTVDAGEGSEDKVIYASTSANYQFSNLASQDITVTDNVGSDGIDELSNVEIIEFADQTLIWDGSSWIDPSAPTTIAGQFFSGTESLDNIVGTAGNDTIFGNGFFDFLDGADGDDWINGGSGNDIIFYSSGNDTVDGGVGFDSFNYTPADGIGISLLVDLEQGIAENRDIANGDQTTLINIDRSALGGTGDHYIIGNHNGNSLSAEAGNDTIEAGDGNDTLFGGSGNDFLDGGKDADIIVAGEGNDTLDGGDGDDVLFGVSGDNVFVLNGSFGEDTINDDGGIVLVDDETLVLSSSLTDVLEANGRLFASEQVAGTDHLKLTEIDALGVVITPSNSITINDYFLNEDNWNFQVTDNEIDGTVDADILIGDAGDDVFYGHGGDDSIIGGDGDDRSFGGEGDDTIIGNDGVDTLRGDEGSDVILGGGGDDRLLGQGGTDFIDGGEGDDWLWGNDDLGELQVDANDTLMGGNGNDTIIGDYGDDRIIGGTGKDLMRGEEGADTFVYTSAADSGLNSNNEHDVIQQFSQADGDQIDFSSMAEGTFTFLSNGNANLDFTGVGNEIAYRNLGNSSKLFVDVDGDSVTDMEINFVQSGGIDFTSSDFVL